MATTKMIQSVERAFSILELFQAKTEELSLKEIAQALELNKSTAFGLVNTLSALGYLQQNEENQKYTLGLRVLSLVNAMKFNNILIRASRPYLEALSQKYHETVHSAVESAGSVVYLDKVEADSSIYINTQMGTKNYMHCTGVGKCLLAFKPEGELDEFLKRPLKALTFNTITDPDAFRAEMALSRARGYAMDNEEIEIGLTCVAVPVFSAPGTATFAISLSGPTARMPGRIAAGLIPDMKETAAELSRVLYAYDPARRTPG